MYISICYLYTYLSYDNNNNKYIDTYILMYKHIVINYVHIFKVYDTYFFELLQFSVIVYSFNIQNY